ncbi:MarR family winged helix-turn-helix transcriptional regulator [Vannielia litorea]|uniref:MarR family winged helix-turn-helix transcriptional regulator n=1 Tax=Vannielia litorea TaxID=1217970 RepID=UPI001BD11486|nr:hypothetical protein [Vannielia litorea]MBS8226593.1 MarR family transcriptional regulator [Vannielia litorea]
MDTNRFGALATLIEDRVKPALGDVSHAEAAALSALYFRPGIYANALPPLVGLCQPGVARMLRGLERRGYVRRRPAVGRVVPIELTEEGREEVTRFHAARRDALNSLLAPLAPEERRLLAALADKLLQAAIPSRAEGRRTCRLCDYERCGETGCPVEAKVDKVDGGVDWRGEYQNGRRPI